MKEKIVYCDFRRSERAKEKEQLAKQFNEVLKSGKWLTEEIVKIREQMQLLIQEDKKYANCKYWK